ncbi:MAG: alpha/beta hydrolase family protein [Terricaulis sp.]
MMIIAALAAALALLATQAQAQTNTPSDPAIGVYAFSGGREVYIEYLPDIQGLAVVEFPSGRVRPLRSTGEQSFTFGPTIGAPEPVVASLQIEGRRLRWRENDRTSTGREISLRTESVSIRSGEITLAGTLTLPRGSGPHPAIVLLHGGGAQTRDFFWLPHFLARRGFAVLAYDKRGVGQSTGDWRNASVQDLADDALAAVAFLNADRRIRDHRIGLYGASAGGWTAPVAAQRAPDQIAFVIVRSGSFLTERRNVIYEVESDLRAAGYGDDVVAAARALHQRDIAVVEAGGVGWEDLRAALRAASGEPWFALARLPPDLIPHTSENEARIAAHIASQRRNVIDPPGLWAQLRMPILFQVGAFDRYVPGPETAERLRAALSGNPRAQVKLYPTGDHPMFDSTTGYGRDIPNVSRYSPGYLEDLDAFVRQEARR